MAQPEDRPEKIFTPAEANAILPKIIPLVEQLKALHGSLLETHQQLKEVTDKLSQGNGHPIRSIQEEVQKLSRHQMQLADAFQSALDQLERSGCMLKDIRTGLADFYSLKDGELIFLCWQLGEKRVVFWHPLEGGYAARKPID